MNISELTVNIVLKRRGFWGTLRRFPMVYREYYRVARQDNGRLVSFKVVWTLARWILVFET